MKILIRKHSSLAYSDLNICLLLCFIIFVSLGSYWEINDFILLIFSILSLLIGLKRYTRVLSSLRENKISKIWLVFIAETFLSTIKNKRWSGIHNCIIMLVVFAIVLVLTSDIDFNRFFIVLKNFVLLLSVISIIGWILNIDVFGFLKVGTVYNSIDVGVGGGISTIFEYRHFYGIYLICAIITQIYNQSKSKTINLLIIIILALNLVLTYTRNSWLAMLFCMIIYLLKKRNKTIKKSSMMYAIYIVAVVVIFAIIFYEWWLPILSNITSRMQNIRASLFNAEDYKYIVRVYTLINGPHYILQNWKKLLLLGGGYGQAMDWLSLHPAGRWGEWTAAIDVQYVTTFMDSGIIGVLLLGYILIYGYIIYFRTKNKQLEMLSLIVITYSIVMAFFEYIGVCQSCFILFNIIICSYRLLTKLHQN